MIRLLILAAAVVTLGGCFGPKAAFTYATDRSEVPARVTFENTSTKAESYSWEFGDGQTSEEVTPSHEYLISGDYTVILTAAKGKKTDKAQMDLSLNAPKSCLIRLETTYGNMLIELYDDTPLHRENFVKLAEEEFFNDLLFHRVINGFMIQGGDPESKEAKPGSRLGMGGPGYQVDAEFDESHVHLKGAIAAARTGGPMNPQKRSSGSQFYIVQGSPVDDRVLDLVEARNGISYSPEQREQYKELGGTPQLDMEYTVFGRVVEGLDVIDKIAAVRTNGADRPDEDVRMKVIVVK